jgi:hypothetical protein
MNNHVMLFDKSENCVGQAMTVVVASMEWSRQMSDTVLMAAWQWAYAVVAKQHLTYMA